MTDLEPLLLLWRELETAGSDYVLATIVAVVGSSYRRPGARMLIAEDGRRAGTVSGGCLEAEVAKRAWWLTANGPIVERYSTAGDDEGERPYGSGCGGTVSLLLERHTTARAHLRALQTAFNDRVSLAIATVVDGPRIGERALVSPPLGDSSSPADSPLLQLARKACIECTSQQQRILINGEHAQAWADYRPALPGLWIFGAGDDVKPLHRLAHELGWFVAVADGRSHLAARERFSSADELHILNTANLPAPHILKLNIRTTDAAVVMTHSFEQDSRILASLLAMEAPPAYIGVLGPQRRTRELLAEGARLLNRPSTEPQLEKQLSRIHSPAGLDLGAETPAAIALSILAEAQQTLNHASAQPLSVVRAARLEAAQRSTAPPAI